MELSSEMKAYIKDNPDRAENQEDLLNWTCDKFDVAEGRTVDAILSYMRKVHPQLEN